MVTCPLITYCCQVPGCERPGETTYAVELRHQRPMRYATLCADHNAEMLEKCDSPSPESVLAFLASKWRRP